MFENESAFRINGAMFNFFEQVSTRLLKEVKPLLESQKYFIKFIDI
ncbi:hypothetical protein [Solibacillus silvestris]|nr:hypothetical protein [Solibacillus silvestris]